MSYPPYNVGPNPQPPYGGPSPHPPQGYGMYPQHPPYGGYPQTTPGFQLPPGGYQPYYTPQYGQHYESQPQPPAPPHGYGTAPQPPQAVYVPSQRAPAPTTPATFTFAQKDFDGSGSIKDGSGKVAYKLKDEADKHTWTAYLKSRPLNISRPDGSKVASVHWKDGPDSAKLEDYAVWCRGGEGRKLQFEGEILDRNRTFRLPNGFAYGWTGPTQNGQFVLGDHQRMQGEGLDAQPKSVARYTPHSPKFDATLDIMPEALAVPRLLDATILTTFYLEYTLDTARTEAELSGL